MALRLKACLRGPKYVELVDAAVPPIKGHVDERSVESEDLHTPTGLPIRFSAYFRGEWGEIVVLSAEALLLRLATHVNCSAQLLLPTDEVLEVMVLNY